MKQKLAIFGFGLALVLAAFGGQPGDTVQALTAKEKQECYEKWAGAYTGSSGDGRKLSQNQLNQFEKSECYSEKKGSCNLVRYSDGAAIQCERSDGKYDGGDAGWGGTEGGTDGENTGDDGEKSGGATKVATGELNPGNLGIPKISADDVLGNVLRLVYYAAGVVAVVGIIISGIAYATSGGDSGKLTRAKDGILYSVIGLIVVVMAFVITGFITGRFG